MNSRKPRGGLRLRLHRVAPRSGHGACQAVGVIHRRDIADAEDPRAKREELPDAHGSEHQSAWRLCGGMIDEAILPAETRSD
jgi:acetyl-CoA carboxylase carboxyltransferase component